MITVLEGRQHLHAVPLSILILPRQKVEDLFLQLTRLVHHLVVPDHFDAHLIGRARLPGNVLRAEHTAEDTPALGRCHLVLVQEDFARLELVVPVRIIPIIQQPLRSVDLCFGRGAVGSCGRLREHVVRFFILRKHVRHHLLLGLCRLKPAFELAIPLPREHPLAWLVSCFTIIPYATFATLLQELDILRTVLIVPCHIFVIIILYTLRRVPIRAITFIGRLGCCVSVVCWRAGFCRCGGIVLVTSISCVTTGWFSISFDGRCRWPFAHRLRLLFL
mmetsp:Transcript_2309/g.4051  ORF Transcript_2309/g.4051 Transcript_2309/m.4051 type:complete len:276 (-) Transcript_2309:1097-1924(-)